MESTETKLLSPIIEWFPMRVAYGREERVIAIKDYLDSLSIENFLPMQRKAEEVNGHVKYMLRPAINNLIFIHATRETISDLKHTRKQLFPLRYMMWHPTVNKQPTIISIPDYQMENFMRVASVQDDRVMFFQDKDFSHKIGRRVKITDGIFKDVEGIVCRVKKDRRVVVSLAGVASIAISYISPSLLEEI